jgi:hypothetical protein
MGALFKDKLADWLSVVTQYSDSDSVFKGFKKIHEDVHVLYEEKGKWKVLLIHFVEKSWTTLYPQLQGVANQFRRKTLCSLATQNSIWKWCSFIRQAYTSRYAAEISASLLTIQLLDDFTPWLAAGFPKKQESSIKSKGARFRPPPPISKLLDLTEVSTTSKGATYLLIHWNLTVALKVKEFISLYGNFRFTTEFTVQLPWAKPIQSHISISCFRF